MSAYLEKDQEAVLLRIFLGSRDKQKARNLFEVIVEEAREAGLSGATVFEGIMGFGANSVVHHASAFRLSQDLPVVVEVVDSPEKIDQFLPRLKVLLSGGGLITLEKINVLFYEKENDADDNS